MRDVKNTNTTSANAKDGISLSVTVRQLQDRMQYAQIQIRGTMQAIDQILAAATEQGSMLDSQVTEAAEVLGIAREAVIQVVSGLDELAEAFMRARNLLAVTQRSD